VKGPTSATNKGVTNHWTTNLASYPGLLASAFIACSTNVGEGKTESRGMTYLDVWRSGTFLLHTCKEAF